MALHLLSLLLVSTFFGTEATVFTLQNKCTETLWPGILTLANITGYSPVMRGDIKLNQGQSVSITEPTTWLGQVWARTECSSNQASKLNCTTGDCGSNEECGRLDRTPPPTTVANFILNGSLAREYYSISLLYGFNIPISIAASGGSGDCRPISCLADMNKSCPSTLQVRSNNGQVVACKSACLAFNQPKYCCFGAYDSPDACKPSNYSQVFKDACPAAFTYPNDDPSSIVTCKGASYLISFC